MLSRSSTKLGEPCFVHFQYSDQPGFGICAARILTTIQLSRRCGSVSLLAVPNVPQVQSARIVIAAANEDRDLIAIKTMWVKTSDIIPMPSMHIYFEYEDFPAEPDCLRFIAEIVYLVPHPSEQLAPDRALASSTRSSVIRLCS